MIKILITEQLIVGSLQTNCFLYGSNKTREISIFDPGGNLEDILNRISDQNYIPKNILLTHGHFDHTHVANKIHKKLGIPTYASKFGKFPSFKVEKHLIEHDIIELGEERLEVLESPGHSKGGLIFIDYSNRIIFSGDSLFKGSIGRTDLGGNYGVLMKSIGDKIMRNPKVTDDFQVLPGHGGLTNVGQEKLINPFRKDFL